MDFLISSRRERPGDDPIFSLNAEAKKRAASGEAVVNATIGALLEDDGKLAIMPSVVEALSELDSTTVAAYAPIAGRLDFREAVTRDLLARYGLEHKAAAVATPGGTGALRVALDNFLEPHQTVLTSSFYWGPYRTLADESGRSLTTFRMFDDEGRFDVPALESKLDKLLAAQGRALLFLNTPCHNPTGYSLDQQEWNELAQVIERHGKRAPITVLLDVAYAYYAPAAFELCLENLTRLSDSAMVLLAWSSSKSFAQYGLRVGALVAVANEEAERKRIENALTFSCRGLWSNCNAGGMAAITSMLNDPDRRERGVAERAELAQMLARRVSRWNELARPAGLDYPRYDGGFFTTVFCEDSKAVAERLRSKHGVYVVPLNGALRVAICAINEQQIERVVGALAAELGNG
jgi:aromatic-amino-acid transaminase